MYCTDETVTVVQYDRNTQLYTCTVITGVSWYTENKRYLQTTDAKESRETTVRIPEERMPAGLKIQPNDFVLRGRIASEIKRRADLEPYERFAVTEVRDNRRGKRLRHWAVIGA